MGTHRLAVLELTLISEKFTCTVKFVFVHENIKVNKLEYAEIKFFTSYFYEVFCNEVIKKCLDKTT